MVEIKPVTASFIKAQKQFGPALKTSTNPHFRSRYADLSACIEAVIDALHDNGLALSQVTHPCETGVIVETLLIHESGDQITFGRLHVPAAKQDPQGYGSALTYARRYSLMAAMGIAPEDDDGNAAVFDTRSVSVAATTKPAPKPKMRVLYDIRQMEPAKVGAAVRYLRESNCYLDEASGCWICPTKLDRLAAYEVESEG